MKHKLLAIFLSSFLFLTHFATAQNMPRVKQKTPRPEWVAKNPFEQKVIIENKGQFEIPGKVATKDILFGARQGGLTYYFTPTSIWISRTVTVKRSEGEIEQIEKKTGKTEKGDDDDDEDWKYKHIELFHEMAFDGAGQQTTITADSEVSWHYNYTLTGKVNVQAGAWKKITYHNLYPGIDMQIYFPVDNAGGQDSLAGRRFEYSFIVQPGADISQIKIKYNGDVKANPNGTITIKSPYGNFMEYAPVAKSISSNNAINCGFSYSDGHVIFNAENYDKSEPLLIDPLVITPPSYGNPSTNAVYDIDQDNKGNIYAYGGNSPWEILKYNNKGTLLWTYSTVFSNGDIYMGDFAVDRNSQSVYITEGADDNGAEVIKLNQVGNQIAEYGGNGLFTEMWKIAFSTCSNQAVIAGGGNTGPSYTASYLDTTLTTLKLVNTLNDQTAGHHDMWGLSIDDFGNTYMITAHSHGSQPTEFDNVILRLPLPSLAPTAWMVSSNYNFLEINSMTYNISPEYPFFEPYRSSNGYNGMSVSDTTLYTYDSYILKRWRTSNGGLIDSLIVNGKGGNADDDSIKWGGLATDDCGNIFVGSRDSVRQYNSNLQLVQVYKEPDTVYDVKLSVSDTLYIAGLGFITDTAITLPPCHIIQTVNVIHNVTCDSLGSAVISQLSGGTAPYGIVWNTNPVVTTDSVGGLKKGTYIATIKDSSCPQQIYADTIKILGPLKIQLSSNNDTLCQGIPVTITVSNGSNYVWSPAAGLNTTTGASVIATPTINTTYTVIGRVSAGGCLDTEIAVINIHPLPSLTIMPPEPSICIGQSVTLNASGATAYLWKPSTGLSSDTLAKVIANPTITTSYTLYGTSLYGCSDSTKFLLQVNPIPVVSVAPPSTSICDGKSVILTASGATTYRWSPSSGLSSTTNSNIQANPTINTTYTIIGTSLGCSDTTTVPIRVIQDSLKASINSATACQGSPVIITALGASNYIWSPTTGLSPATGDTVTATPATTTTYTLVATGTNGCMDTITPIVITINPPPVLTIAPSTPKICLGQSIGLTVSMNVSGTATYTWSPSTGLSKTNGSAVTANPTITTTYTAYGTDNLGCNDSTKVVVTVNQPPVITVAPPDSAICHGHSTALTASGASIYLWRPSTGLSSTTNSTVTTNPTITTTYVVIGTDAAGCIDSTTVPITVIQNNVIVSPTTTSVCQGNSTVIIASGGTVYNWTPSTGLNNTTGDTIAATPFSTTTYTLIANGNGGCLDTESVVVNVNLPPVLSIVPSSPVICIGHPTPLTVSGASIYTWSPSTGLSQTTGSSIMANPTILTTYTAYGTDVLGCNDSTKVTITVNPLPIVTVAPLDSIVCNGLSVPLTATGALTYQWSPSAGLSSTTNSAVVAAPLATTTYIVYGTDAQGCVDTVSAVVNIIPNSIVIKVVPDNAIICLGNSASLVATGGTNYSWSPSTALNQTSGGLVTASPLSNVTYTVIGTGLGHCADTTSIPIIVSPPPTIAVEPLEPEICDGQAIPLTASGALYYEWSPSTGLYETAGSSVDAHPIITTTYTVYGTDSLNCNDSTKFTVNVKASPVSAFTTSVPSICNQLQIQFSNTTVGGSTYAWNFGDGDSSTEANPVHTFSQPGIYKITLISTSENGCMDTLIANDTLSNHDAGVYIPSSFTPSMPGVNQVFKANVYCATTAGYTFRVYNRWGEVMFETNDPSAGWDGTYHGKIQPLDTYVYYIQMTCGNCSFFKKGNVTLLR